MKLLWNLYNQALSFVGRGPTDKKIREELIFVNSITEKQSAKDEEDVGECEMRFDTGRTTFYASNVRRVVCRRAGAKVGASRADLI